MRIRMEIVGHETCFSVLCIVLKMLPYPICCFNIWIICVWKIATAIHNSN